jgi:hypothetical protein
MIVIHDIAASGDSQEVRISFGLSPDFTSPGDVSARL